MEAYNSYTTRIFEFCENEVVWLRFNTYDFTFYWTEDGKEYSTSDFLFSLDDSEMFSASVDLNTTPYKFGSDINASKAHKGKGEIKAKIKIIKKPLKNDQQNNAFFIMKKLTDILHKINNIKLSFDFNEYHIEASVKSLNLKDPIGGSFTPENNIETGDFSGFKSMDVIRGLPPKYNQTSVMPVKINGWQIEDDGYIESSLSLSLKYLNLGWKGEDINADLTGDSFKITSDLPVNFEMTFSGVQISFLWFQLKRWGFLVKQYYQDYIPSTLTGSDKLTIKTNQNKDDLSLIYETNGYKYNMSFLLFNDFKDGLFHKIDVELPRRIEWINKDEYNGMETFKYTPYWIF